MLGPLADAKKLPQQVDDRSYKTIVPSANPVRLTARWETYQHDRRRARSDRSFPALHHDPRRERILDRQECDATHYLCPFRQEAATLRSASAHDDAVRLSVNGKELAALPGGDGLRSSAAVLPLNAGWNELAITLENENNVDWRWNGLMMATKGAAGLRFALMPVQSALEGDALAAQIVIPRGRVRGSIVSPRPNCSDV